MEHDEEAYAAGTEAARADATAGRLVYRWSGHAGHWGHWVVTQLAKRFGVSVSDGFGVCVVSARCTSFNLGYNTVLAAEVDRRHGTGAVEAVFAESREQSELALADARRAWLGRGPDAEPGAAADAGRM